MPSLTSPLGTRVQTTTSHAEPETRREWRVGETKHTGEGARVSVRGDRNDVKRKMKRRRMRKEEGEREREEREISHIPGEISC